MKPIKPPVSLSPDLPGYLALRLRDAAPVMGCEPATLRKKCAAGLIPGAWRTSGNTGDWRIPFSTLKPLLENRSRAGQPLNDQDATPGSTPAQGRNESSPSSPSASI